MNKNISKDSLLWDKILNYTTAIYMQKLSALESGDEFSEDLESIGIFFDDLKTKMNYKVVIVIATQWRTFTHVKQANVAMISVGEEHASRFMMMMDYLSYKYQKGELK